MTVAALLAAAVASAGCTDRDGGATGGSGSPSRRPTPFTGTPAQYEAELQAIAKELAPASPGAVAGQERLLQACLRLERLRDTFQRDIPSRERAGMPDGEYVFLHRAATDCSSNPVGARQTIDTILRERHD